MKFFEQMERLERIDQLIRMKATGKPKELANRLEISERRLYDLINIMKEMGAPINYCNNRLSYYYESEGKLLCNMKFELGVRSKVMGGASGIYDLLQNICSENIDLNFKLFQKREKPNCLIQK